MHASMPPAFLKDMSSFWLNLMLNFASTATIRLTCESESHPSISSAVVSGPTVISSSSKTSQKIAFSLSNMVISFLHSRFEVQRKRFRATTLNSEQLLKYPVLKRLLHL